mgnify:CR=1 FL=1
MPKLLLDEEIPEELKTAIEAANIGDNFLRIIKKYRLHIDQEAGAWAAIELLVRGGAKPDDFVKKIERLGQIDHRTAIEIGQDINKEILLPIRDTLKKIAELAETHGAELEGKESIMAGIMDPEAIGKISRPSRIYEEEPVEEEHPAPVAVLEKPLIPDLSLPELPAPTAEDLTYENAEPAGVTILPAREGVRVVAPLPEASIPTPTPTIHEEKFATLSRIPTQETVVSGDPKQSVIPEDMKTRAPDPYREAI